MKSKSNQSEKTKMLIKMILDFSKRIEKKFGLGEDGVIEIIKEFSEYASKVNECMVKKIKNSIILSSFISAKCNSVGTGNSLRKGAYGRCPFCGKKKFKVNDEKMLWHCFGCKESGDVYSFLMKKDGINFVRAYEILSEMVFRSK